MAITGGIKFLSKSWADIDFDDDVTITMTSGSTTRHNMRSRARHTRTESEGSDDATTETWVITFAEAKTFDRIILGRHNFKQFTIKYWNGSAFVAFSTAINETANADENGSYFEFDSVSSEKIEIAITTTQTADEDKHLYHIQVAAEIGTLQGYPAHQFSTEFEQAAKQVVSGRQKFTIFDEFYRGSLTFAPYYPTSEDHELMARLWAARQEFLIYPCGGDSSQFRYPFMPGYRKEDVFLVWIDGRFDPNHFQNVYCNGMGYTLNLAEVA